MGICIQATLSHSSNPDSRAQKPTFPHSLNTGTWYSLKMGHQDSKEIRSQTRLRSFWHGIHVNLQQTQTYTHTKAFSYVTVTKITYACNKLPNKINWHLFTYPRIIIHCKNWRNVVILGWAIVFSVKYCCHWPQWKKPSYYLQKRPFWSVTIKITFINQALNELKYLEKKVLGNIITQVQIKISIIIYSNILGKNYRIILTGPTTSEKD